MQYNGEIAVSLIVAFLSISVNLYARNLLRINFLWMTNLIFIFVVFPKIALLLLEGDQILITSGSFLTLQSMIAAIFLICAFVTVINLTYTVSTVLGNRGSPRQAPIANVDIPVWPPLLVIILPIFLVSFVLFLYMTGVSFESLFLKPELIENEELTISYFLQKASQIIKCGAFLLMARLIAHGAIPSGERILFAVVGLLTVMVFLFSGQRSGIALFVIQLVLCFQLAGKLSPRVILTMGAIFMAANFAILSARFALSREGTLSFADVFLRRYFFDIEKIAGVLEFASRNRAYLFDPVQVFFDISSRPEINMPLHRFLGTYAFGTSSGVPPSVLGDIVFYLGGAFVIPVTIALTLLIIRLERLRSVLRDPRAQLALITVLSTLYLFLLNSDTGAALNRIALELLFLGVAFGSAALFRPLVRRAQLGASGSGA